MKAFSYSLSRNNELPRYDNKTLHNNYISVFDGEYKKKQWL